MRVGLTIKLLLLSVLLGGAMSSYAVIPSPEVNAFLKSLDYELQQRPIYQNQKISRIDSLKARLTTCTDETCRYAVLQDLSEEYTTFVYDSALVYSQRRLSSALALQNQVFEVDTRLNLAFVLISSGLFTEAKDMLSSIDLAQCSKEQKRQYYSDLARLNFDLAVYANDEYYSPLYQQKGIAAQDSVLRYESSPIQKEIDQAQLDMRKGNVNSAIYYFEQTLKSDLSYKDEALVTSCLGYLYAQKGDSDDAVKMLSRAAIADTRNVTKETVALRELATTIKTSSPERAERYIRFADEDAKFYHARQRMSEIGNVSTGILQELMKKTEEQKNNYIRFFIAMCLLVIIGVILLGIVIKQNKKLSETRDLILQNNKELQKSNAKLQETNRIKEEYIGYFFRTNADFIQSQEDLRKRILSTLQSGDTSAFRTLITDADIEAQRAELYKNFDKIFLKIFPTFVEDFNKMFAPDDQYHLTDPESLNSDLRIFALIRLGIKDNEDIAEFLNYSVNTIYTYKAKIKNRSVIDNAEFEKRIMQIRAV